MNRPPGGRNRQNGPNGPDHTHFSAIKPPRGYRSYPFFDDQTAARLPPHPDAPGILAPWDPTETESEAQIMRYGQNRQNLVSAPRTSLFFGVQTAVRLPSHPDAPRTVVPWDPTETELEAWIMSYGPFFAAPEAVRYSHPGYPPAGRTLPNPTKRVRHLRFRPAVPPGA